MLSIRHAVTRNWFLKLFSILLAIIGESATEVSLQLLGSSNLLNEISPADIAAVISLAGETPGEKNVQLTASSILTPFGVEVLRFDPPRVQFTLEQTLTRTIPVRPIVEGDPAEDFVVGTISVVPSPMRSPSRSTKSRCEIRSRS